MSAAIVEPMLREFFEREELAGLVLPDGWYGRPGDNLHRLTFSAARPKRLVVELDDQVLLSFTGPVSASVQAGDPPLDDRQVLTIGGYSQCIFAPLSYGSDRPAAPKVYKDGLVRLVAQPRSTPDSRER